MKPRVTHLVEARLGYQTEIGSMLASCAQSWSCHRFNMNLCG